MRPTGLTAVMRVKSGEEEPLRAVLNRIGNDIKGNRLDEAPQGEPHIHFYDSRETHFARLVMLPDPDAGEGRERLLFSSNFDGELESYLYRVEAITTNVDAIWGRCEGYDGDFPTFIKKHMYPIQTFYAGFRDETVHSLKQRVEDREQFTASTGIPVVPPFEELFQRVTGKGIGKSGRNWGQIALPMLWNLLKLVRRFGPFTLISVGRRLLGVTPLRSQHSTVVLDRCSDCEEYPLAPVVSQGSEVVGEDVITQNQMNILSDIDPSKLKRLEAVLAIVNLAAKYITADGMLAGISTIHFARWVIIDDGRRLLFESNYDGSWENYIGDFVDKAFNGLDAIWENCIGYPPAGARDIQAFRRVIRCHQVQSNVFYSAYPGETVLNILNDCETGRLLERGLDQKVIESLQALQ